MQIAVAAMTLHHFPVTALWKGSCDIRLNVIIFHRSVSCEVVFVQIDVPDVHKAQPRLWALGRGDFAGNNCEWF